MTPLRGHSEETVKGHLMLSQMAATINVYIQKKMKKYYENREDTQDSYKQLYLKDL